MNAEELRARIVETVSRNGGHLASPLGAVEIALALVESFDPQVDRIVWDVGHQAYAWKLLTGRADRFGTLRRLDGLAPFPLPSESAADPAVCGHAGVALSVAAGLAAARDRRGSSEHVVAVIGDEAFANGTTLEALSTMSSLTGNLIVVFNDNGSRVRPTGLFDAAFFAHFGFRTVGPVDGHDLASLKAAFAEARTGGLVVIHARTQKGRGFAPAESDPSAWHGTGPFDLTASADHSSATEDRPRTWSEAFGQAVVEAAKVDGRIVALTAGMTDGTGLAPFAATYPDRFYDVGIAEGHMVALAAGLAAGGLRPVVTVYSTFLQRAVDQVIHDVCIANRPVVFCVDRAGCVGADGVTHQGLYDIALLRAIPNLTICQPQDAEDLKALLEEALRRNGPTVIRYPRGPIPPFAGRPAASVGRPRFAIWVTGDQLSKAEAVAAAVGGEVTVARYLKPFDAMTLARQRADGLAVVSIENGAVAGGFGEAIGADFRFGWPDTFVPHGPVADLERRYGFDVASIVAALNPDKGNRMEDVK